MAGPIAIVAKISEWMRFLVSDGAYLDATRRKGAGTGLRRHGHKWLRQVGPGCERQAVAQPSAMHRKPTINVQRKGPSAASAQYTH